MLSLFMLIILGLAPPAGPADIEDTKARLVRLNQLALRPDAAQREWVISQLRLEDVTVQRAALRTVGFYREPQAMPYILPFLQSDSKDVQISALFACARLGTADPLLIQEVADRSDDAYVKLAAQAVSVQKDDQDAVGRLGAKLRSNDLRTISIASTGLAILGEESGMEAVLELMTSPSDEKRNIAAQACLDAPYRGEWLQRISAALDVETYGYVQASMIQALINMGRQDVDQLARVLASSTKAPDIVAELKIDACFAGVQDSLLTQLRLGLQVRQGSEIFRNFDDEKVKKTMRWIVNDSGENGRKLLIAVTELGRLRDLASIAPLRKLLNRGSNAEIRGRAAVALAQLKDAESIPPIVDMLGAPEADAKRFALQAVAIMRILQAIPAVEVLQNDQDRGIATEAAQIRELLIRKESMLLAGVYWLGYDGFCIQGPKKTVYIDPYKITDGLPKADVILITHDHEDHLSPGDLSKIATKDTVLYLPAGAGKVGDNLPGSQIRIKAGEVNNETGLTIKALKAYNLRKPFHPPQYGGLGYYFAVGGVTYYHAGDTDLIPEMKEFPPADVCFLPVSGTYVMTAAEAAEATKVLKCRKAVPMHYGAIVGSDKDSEEFKRLAACPVEILPKVEKIP